VVGDLAQVMVAQNLEPHDVIDQADTLAFPDSVINYLRGEIGVPPGGFPEPLTTKVLSSRGLSPVNGRPGKYLDPYNFEKEREYLEGRFGVSNVNEKELLSYALYPDVYVEWKEFQASFGEVGTLPTHLFLNPMKVGDEVEIPLAEKGKDLIVKLSSIQDARKDGTRMVIFEVNGEPWYLTVTDLITKGEGTDREKATEPGHVGAPMPGVLVKLSVQAGNKVKEGEPVATLSAMKMETSIPATRSGTVKRILATVGEKVEGDDLLMEIE